ncbi:MAG: hypothetical protein KY445_00685 [Armatimonadetes bacterium]|nr:hypothetical protein [Armatimonadota bacterium]
MAVSSWQWLWDFEDRARRDGDAARVRLATYYEIAERVPFDSPDEQLAIYEAARALAIQLGERWFEMFYEHWVIEVLLFGKQQPRLALDRAVPCARFSRLPNRSSPRFPSASICR